jgi:hypothetical protein
MKQIFTVAFTILISCHAWGQVIIFPFNKTPVTIDGTINQSEWQNANSVKIAVNTSDTVLVQFQHDSTNMYFAFSGKLESANALFPEVLFDADHLHGANWVNGQWWFHVSATDCENNGGYGIYTNCSGVQPGWQGAPNFTAGSPYTDSVEIKIPFSKAGVNLANDTIGISFVVTNTATIFKPWPSTADKDVPATWGHAVFSKFPVGIKPVKEVRPTIFPNPVADVLSISGIQPGTTATILDLSGKVLLSASTSAGNTQVPVSHLAAGTYLLKIVDGAGVVSMQQVVKL